MKRTAPFSVRRGYTLVELLVVMGLIILLAALALGISQSGMLGSQKVISASDRTSQWLLISKQRAIRDQAPRGVRFYSNPAGGFTEAQYIESPEAWVPNPAQEANFGGPRIMFAYQYTLPAATMANPNPVATVTSTKIYFVSGIVAGNVWNPGTAASDMTEFDQRVTVGDSLTLPELGKSFFIRAIKPLTAANANLITHSSSGATPTEVDIPPQFARELELVPGQYPDLSAAGSPVPAGPPGQPARVTMVTYKYGFQGVPRPLLGEPTLQLTFGCVIDYRPGRRPGLPNPPSPAPVPPFTALPYTTLEGYRDWANPAPMPPGTPNTGPFNPSTSIGIRPIQDPANAAGTYFDILFTSSGQVWNNPSNIIVLWVRDASKVPHPRLDGSGNSVDGQAEYNAAGEQALVVLNVRTGLISTQPVFPPPAVPSTGYDPYQFAKDGLNSGL